MHPGLVLGGVTFAVAASVVSARASLRARPTSSVYDVLVEQLEDLRAGRTDRAYALASDANRANTGSAQEFDAMVRRYYAPLLSMDDFAIGSMKVSSTSATVDIVSIARCRDSGAYRFRLRKVRDAWRTDSVEEVDNVGRVRQDVKSRRQASMRRTCFINPARAPKHSFGRDRTHNLCCNLGPRAREYADGGPHPNPIGAASAEIGLTREGHSRWSTCLGSNVCGVYADKFHDGTRGVFATNYDLTKVVTNVPRGKHCEAKVARALNTTAHGTPGIRTQGDPSLCRQRVDVIEKECDVDAWLHSWS